MDTIPSSFHLAVLVGLQRHQHIFSGVHREHLVLRLERRRARNKVARRSRRINRMRR